MILAPPDADVRRAIGRAIMKTQYTCGSARNISLAATTLVTSTLLSGALSAFAPGVACAQQMEGGTGKYKGITGSEPFACITMPALAGPGGYTAMDIPHNTTWEIK